MDITDFQKSIQIADDLDEQANRLNLYISDPEQSKADRVKAVEAQNKLRREAAKLRIDTITEIIGDQAPTIDAIVSAADKARSAANKIGKIKSSLELATATITFFAALSTQDLPKIIKAFSNFQDSIKSVA
ncbi:MAG TPA: hypothetical protein VGJ90_03360 [Methylophilaceae bacterium]|jgi:hypothetical protein